MRKSLVTILFNNLTAILIINKDNKVDKSSGSRMMQKLV